MKEIKIQIPTKPEFKRRWEIVKFKFHGGFVCSECGVKMFFDDVQVESTVHGKRFMFHDHNFRNPPRCSHRIQKEIDENAKWIFTFGSSWWNGHYICNSCMHTGVDVGTAGMKSSIYGWDAKKTLSLPQNRLGMLKYD